MNIPQAAKKPSVWIAVISGGAALAQALTSIGEPHLAFAGLILSAIFKVAESTHDAYIGGKKLEVEKQFVTSTAVASPSVMVSAKAAGFPVEIVMPAPAIDPPAPVIQP